MRVGIEVPSDFPPPALSLSPELQKRTNSRTKTFSRRDFLKLSGLAVGGAFTVTEPVLAYSATKIFGWVNSLKNNPEVGFFPENADFSKYPQYGFDKEIEGLINRVKVEKNITIISPTFWYEPTPTSKNLAWVPKENFDVLVNTIGELPNGYLTSQRSPKQIVLLRTPNTSSEGAGGGYMSRCVLLNIPSDFNANNDMHGYASEIYGKSKNHLRFRIAHEFTHSYSEAHPDILKDFINSTGWRQASNGWTNSEPWGERNEDNADKDPNEDLAMSFGRFLVNPSSLSSKRLNFFLTNPYYSEWATKHLANFS